MNATKEFTEVAIAADSACTGCAIIGNQNIEAGWIVAERVDGLRVRIDGVNASSPAIEAVNNLDMSEAAIKAREINRIAARSVSAIIQDGKHNPITAAIVALFDTVFTLLNDERELRGAARLTEADLIPLAITALVQRLSN